MTGAEQGPLQRPHLTLNNKLIGTGAFARAAARRRDYQRGYLCGMIRGDGHLGRRVYERPNGRRGEINQFRLALTDFEALARAQSYLAE